MEKLAIFDVDYTLTKRETLMEFFLFMVIKKPSLIFHMPISIGSALLYALNIYNAKTAKEKFIKFINGIDEKQMKSYVSEFYEKRLSKIFYKDAINTMTDLKSKGFKIYLISASGEFYLNELYNLNIVDKIIGTKFIVEGGKYKNIILGENCKGEEKVKRLLEVIREESITVDFKESYMYSDSLSDMPLFKMVGHPYLVNPRKNHGEIEKIVWR